MKSFILSLLFLFSLSAFSMEKPPVATVQGSTNYTVPAGKWARAVVTVWQGGTFSINATQVIASYSGTWSVLGSSALTHNGGGLFTAANGASGSAFTAATATMATQSSEYYYVRPGDALLCSGNCKYHIEIYKL